MVSVAAKDLGTGKTQTVVVQPTSGLSESEIGGFIAESESSRQVDLSKREWADLRNGADTLIYGTERTLQEFGDKLDMDAKARLQMALDECKRTLEMFTGDVVRGRDAISKLETEAHMLFMALQGGSMSESEPSPDDS
jgi:molecular chaperone DnaK